MTPFTTDNILKLLRTLGPKTLTEIKQILNDTKGKTTVLYHLKKLIDEGKIVKEGFKYSFYAEKPNKLIRIPCYGIAQAGPQTGSFSQFSDDQVKFFVAIPPTFIKGHNPKDLFIMETAGDSMQPTIQAGDLVLFKKYNDALPADDDVALYKVNKKDLKIKRFKRLNTYGLLCSDNPKYAPMIINEDTDTPIGKMIDIIGN